MHIYIYIYIYINNQYFPAKLKPNILAMILLLAGSSCPDLSHGPEAAKIRICLACAENVYTPQRRLG